VFFFFLWQSHLSTLWNTNYCCSHHPLRTDLHRIVLEKIMLYLHTYCRSKILFIMSSRVLAQREEETYHFASTSFPAIYFSSMWDLRTSVSRDLVLYAYPLDPIRNVLRPLLDLRPPRIEETIDSARMHLTCTFSCNRRVSRHFHLVSSVSSNRRAGRMTRQRNRILAMY